MGALPALPARLCACDQGARHLSLCKAPHPHGLSPPQEPAGTVSTPRSTGPALMSARHGMEGKKDQGPEGRRRLGKAS